MKNKYCCQRFQETIEHKCQEHDNPFDCPDCLIYFLSKNKEFGLIVHDGGTSFITISYCPFCGEKLKKKE